MNPITIHVEDKLQVIKGQFSIDDGERYFDGYTFGDLWNGWACPYFTKETGIAIAEHYEKKWGLKLAYHEANDEMIEGFTHTDDDGYEDEFSAVRAIYNGKELTLFGIGAFGWVWWDMKWNTLT
jgi:hypothetical protein